MNRTVTYQKKQINYRAEFQLVFGFAIGFHTYDGSSYKSKFFTLVIPGMTIERTVKKYKKDV